MQFGKYQFKCTLQRDAQFPQYKGSTFRGGFGHALKKVSCTVRHGDCSSCLLSQRCLYSRTFELTGIQPHSKVRLAQSPRPYIIRPPHDKKTHFVAGENFNFTLILFGDTNDYLPYFIYAFDAMGKTGLGKKVTGHRATYQLDRVEIQGQQIYTSCEQQLATDFQCGRLNPPDLSGMRTNGQLTLTIKTPLRLKFDNHLQAALPFSLLVRAMLRRVSSLFATYAQGEPPLDYRGLVERAQQVEIVSDNLSWFDWQRYSNRQEAKMLMGGIVGSVTYRGNIGEYLPLLELARELHLGKQTAFGLGQIDFEWVVS